MLQEYVLGNCLLLDNLACADILANIAVLADFGVDAGMGTFFINSTVGAVCLAVAAQGAAGGAILCLFLGSILGGAGNHLDALVRHNGDKMLGACIGAVTAADALVGIDLGDTVNHADSVIAANADAGALAEAAGGAQAQTLQIQILGIFAVVDTHLADTGKASAVAGAADESNLVLDFGEIVIGVDNDLLAALDGAHLAADALVIVDHGMVVDNMYGVLRAGALAFAAGNAAEAANLAHSLLILFRRGAGDEARGIRRDHADQTAGANALFCAVAAAVALGGVDDHTAVLFNNCALRADLCAVAAGQAAAAAFAAAGLILCGLRAACSACEVSFSPCSTRAGDKGNQSLLVDRGVICFVHLDILLSRCFSFLYLF